MPRPLRKIGQGLTHHCYTRCHGRKNLLIGKYGRKYFVEAEIVSNHIHLVIRTLQELY